MAQKQIHFDDLEVKAHSVTLSATDGDVLLNRTEAGGDGSVIVSSGGIVAANEDNLVAVNGDGSIKPVSAPDARTALGLGSAATQDSSNFLQPGTASGSGVRSDGTLVPPTLSQIPIITGGGWIGASGKSFGASVAEATKAESSDRAATLRDAWRASFMAARVFDASTFSETSTGSGITALGTVNDTQGLQTGSTAGSTAILQSGSNSVGISPGSNRITTLQNREFILSFSFFSNSSGSLPAAGGFRYTFGKSSAYAGPLTSQGFGILCKEGGALYGVYNNGAGEIEIDLETTAVYRLVQEVCIFGDGTGGLEWIVNGVSVGSVANYSTSSLSNVRVTADVLNDTESFNFNFLIWSARMATLY